MRDICDVCYIPTSELETINPLNNPTGNDGVFSGGYTVCKSCETKLKAALEKALEEAIHDIRGY